MRRISVFGATGSVGESTFDLLMHQGGPARFHTVALTGARNVRRLAEMALALKAEVAVTADATCLPDLRAALHGSGVHAAAGPQAQVEAACNAAKEVALALFIAGRIGFMDMAGLVETTLANLSSEISLGKAATVLDDIIAMDQLARIRARDAVKQFLGG